MTTYFSTRGIAAIAICASLWGVLNSIFAPVFFTLTHLPFFCDMIGFAVLILAAWWIKKFGAITIIGAIATLINFALVPNPYHFLGFTAASVFFDFAISILGFHRPFKEKTATVASMITLSILSAALAGSIIEMFFMSGAALAPLGGVLGWAGLHVIGGIIGGSLGISIVTGLESRKITANHTYKS